MLLSRLDLFERIRRGRRVDPQVSVRTPADRYDSDTSAPGSPGAPAECTGAAVISLHSRRELPPSECPLLSEAIYDQFLSRRSKGLLDAEGERRKNRLMSTEFVAACAGGSQGECAGGYAAS